MEIIEPLNNAEIVIEGKHITFNADTITMNGNSFTSLTVPKGTTIQFNPGIDDSTIQLSLYSIFSNATGLLSCKDIDYKNLIKTCKDQTDFSSFMTGFESGLNFMLEQMSKYNDHKNEINSTELE